MSNITLLKQLNEIKKVFEVDGFIIDGVFGSYARGEETKESDVDILYHLNSLFYEKYLGFDGFKKLDDIKQSLAKMLGKNVDLAPKTNLSNTAQKYILKDVVYV